MKASIELNAQARPTTGTGAARAVRRSGFVPAVVYAKDKGNVALSVDAKTLSLAYFKGGFMSKLVALNVDGKNHFAIPRDIQLNPVSDKIEHADFLAVDEKSVVKVLIPVHFQNTATSVGIKRGGVLNIVRHTVELLCPVTAIPSAVDVDVAKLNIGDSVQISDLTLPAGVKSASTRDLTVASLTGRGKDEEENPAAAAASAAAVPASTAKAPADAKAAPAAAAKPAAKK